MPAAPSAGQLRAAPPHTTHTPHPCRYENSSAAAAAAQQQRGMARGAGGGNVFYAEDGFDPEEIFNMFFGCVHAGVRVQAARKPVWVRACACVPACLHACVCRCTCRCACMCVRACVCPSSSSESQQHRANLSIIQQIPASGSESRYWRMNLCMRESISVSHWGGAVAGGG